MECNTAEYAAAPSIRKNVLFQVVVIVIWPGRSDLPLMGATEHMAATGSWIVCCEMGTSSLLLVLLQLKINDQCFLFTILL